MSRVLFFPPTINGETEWISPKEDIMFQSLSELLGAYQKRDPAARSKLEIFLLYPGVHAVIFHRVSHWLYCHHLPFLARLNSQLAPPHRPALRSTPAPRSAAAWSLTTGWASSSARPPRSATTA